MRWVGTTILGLFSLGLLGCGGGGGGNSAVAPPAGVVTLRLAGGPLGGFSALQVKVTNVELEGPSGWIRFAEANKTVDLVGTLSRGGTETLSTSNAPVPPGTYSRVRVSFGSEISGSVGFEPATIAAPEPVIVAVPLVFSGTQQGLVLLLAPFRSLHLRSGQYFFRPSLQVLQDGQIGRVHGRLTAAGQGVAGIVLAQTFQELGVPRLLQCVATRSDGTYTLDLLPKGVPLHVVGFSSGPTRLEPQASPAITLGETPVEWNAALVSQPGSTSVRGAFLPAAAPNQSGEVQLLGPLQAGTEVKLFALSVTATGWNANSENYNLGGIASGSYVLRAYRTTWNVGGTTTTQGQNSTDLGLVSGFETLVDFLW